MLGCNCQEFLRIARMDHHPDIQGTRPRGLDPSRNAAAPKLSLRWMGLSAARRKANAAAAVDRPWVRASEHFPPT